ncbi:hypothetical protein KAFR_0D03240 [Kazachstania africana CBS 2517]|uniref:Cell wall protein CWP1 n=1 Tax=Kazachstania africana (strain ATCC 22294 / BCRC 22015 / CBS 2517 / CECT 1963 / NBRC 1671 / NRRL Y-8276) TaxID=1071382 RepID=H2AUC2_KAZAF|nr:hypothetical protein KAFR_0D03240 [Kazachstania africana CBS 2517]CCF57972.1 hypothetical protein KAFR_0D03240 [Kazachstania africana CBS 2517]
MKFTSNIAFALFVLAKLIVADSETFGLITIRSGSALQYAGVTSVDGTLNLGGSNGLSGTVTDAGKLKLSDDTYAVVQADGTIKEGSESDGTTGFSVTGGRLAYNGSTGFYGVASGSSYILSTSDTSGLGIVLRAQTTSGLAADFTPSGSSSDSSSSADAAASSSVASTVSTAAAAASTVAAVSQITDGQIQATTATIAQQSTNGAAKAAAGLGAGAIAAAALLL